MFFLDADKQYTGTWATIWNVEDKNGFLKARISTSEKDQDGNYKNSSWFATFGKNVADKARNLQKNDRILIKKGKITNPTVTKADGTYVNYLNVDIYYFVTQEENEGGGGSSSTGFPKPTPPINKFKKIEEDAEPTGLPFDL